MIYLLYTLIIGKILILSWDEFISCAGTIALFGGIFRLSQIIVSGNFGCISGLLRREKLVLSVTSS